MGSRKKNRTGKSAGKGKETLSLWFEVIVFLFFALLLYTLASLFSLRTGAWGAKIRFSLLQNMGGAILIPIFFCIYLCIAFFLKTGAEGFLKQLLGSFLLFLCAALMLGLFRMGGLFKPAGILSPGYLGDGLAIFLTRNLGSFGTFLLGLAMLVLSATLYDLFAPASVIAKGTSILRSLRRPLRPAPPAVTQGQGELPLPSHSPSTMAAMRYETAEREGETAVSSQGHVAVRGNSFVLNQKTESPDLASPDETFLANEDTPFSSSPEEDGEDPSAVPEIQFNEVEGPEKKVRGGAFPPPMEIFGPRQQEESAEQNDAVREQGIAIITTLADFGIQAELADIIIGPTVIQFQIQLAPGIKVSRVSGLSNDLAVGLAVPAIRIEAPIPGKPYVGVEIPNPKRKGISIRTVLESTAWQDSELDLPLPMGVRVDSRPLVVGLEELPHLLVAGTTGSGKSVFVTSCITGLCTHRTPEELRLILIDPKRVELSIYENLPHMLAKPVVSPKKAVQALAWSVREMERRYEVFARARVRNLKSYNQSVLPKSQMPHIVIVVDELADLMFTAQKDVEDYICRLAQMARATGIHLILATQRPSVNVITGLIKANVPARVAFTLPSQTDSRTIIDVSGAERLLGKGDMLFVSSKYPRPLRLQSPFIDDSRNLEIIAYLRNVFGDPEYVDIEEQINGQSSGSDSAYTDDPLLREALDIIIESGIASASGLQRRLRVGFTRAARLVDTLEQLGIVSAQDGSKPRELLVDEQTARSLLPGGDPEDMEEL